MTPMILSESLVIGHYLCYYLFTAQERGGDAGVLEWKDGQVGKLGAGPLLLYFKFKDNKIYTKGLD